MKLPWLKLVTITGLLLLISATVLMPIVTAQDEKLGLLRVTRTEYPPQVPRSYSFILRLEIEYAFHDYYEFYSAIYEGAKGDFGNLLWQGETERAMEVGGRSYEVTLKSPPQQGQWVITAYVFVRNTTGSYYFSDPERGPGFAEMSMKVADNARLTLRAPHSGFPIAVDGTSYSTDSTGTITRELKVLSTHTLAAPTNITLLEGWRVIFASWNGTDAANPKTITMTKDLLVTIEFQDEFYLNVTSDVARVRGTGWYSSGSIATFSAPTLVPSQGWEGIFGVQRKFAGWTGDVKSSSPTESIVMDEPHGVVANWTTDYGSSYLILIAVAAVAAVGIALYLFKRGGREVPAETTPAPTRNFCIFCGSEIDPDSKFCSKCGKSQVSSD